MKPMEPLGVARALDGEELKLFRRGDDFMIVLDRNELMNSRMSGSEEALATMTCERLGNRPKPHLLIGGYGMGFTLRAALQALGPDARLTVAELVPEIITWAPGVGRAPTKHSPARHVIWFAVPREGGRVGAPLRQPPPRGSARPSARRRR